MVVKEKIRKDKENKELIFITFDELFIKSEQVRRKLIDKFLENLKLVNIKPLKIERARIYFDKEHYNSLKKIFGIKKIKFAYWFNNLDELKNFLSNFNFQGSFKLEVKRIDKSFPKTSLEVAREIGSFLENKGFKVDLKNPENKFGIEIHKDKILFIYKEEKGLGGFPLGSQGETVSLFSGGIDSPVSSFLIAKRGIKPYYLFISNGNPIVEFKVWLVFNKINQYT
ncbi:MAG: THUMP domain-containing protein, partial [Nanoarchaeota archaeon]